MQDPNTRQWAMILHFSQFAGFIIPVAGFIAPILIWQIKKDEMPELDAHGKMIANWMLSGLIYSAISGVLAFILVGFLLLFILSILAIIFPIIGGIKAGEGKLWPYPLSFKFF